MRDHDELTLLRELAPPVAPASADARDAARARLVRSYGTRGLRGIHTRRRLAVILVPAAVALAAGLVLALSQLGRESETAWAAAALRVAEAAPRLTLAEPGWRIERAQEFTVEQGEMTFTNGTHELDLHWRPAAEHNSRVADRARSASLDTTANVLGEPARLFRYADTTDDHTALWLSGDYSLEARATLSESRFRDLLASLREVSVDAWLSAMPENVVNPVNHAAAVDEMLADIPVPRGLDLDALRAETSVLDRYQLGARVTSTVACAWIKQWITATDTSDHASVQQAIDAMATSHDWAILNEMSTQGAYPQVLRQHADAMQTNTHLPAGSPLTVRESYQNALGCR